MPAIRKLLSIQNVTLRRIALKSSENPPEQAQSPAAVLRVQVDPPQNQAKIVPIGILHRVRRVLCCDHNLFNQSGKYVEVAGSRELVLERFATDRSYASEFGLSRAVREWDGRPERVASS